MFHIEKKNKHFIFKITRLAMFDIKTNKNNQQFIFIFKIRGLAKLDKSGKLQNSFISCPRLKLTFSCMMELNK